MDLNIINNKQKGLDAKLPILGISMTFLELFSRGKSRGIGPQEQ
jgi:hypothetical protein